MRNVDGAGTNGVASEDLIATASVLKVIREMTAGERQASVDREKANNLDKKI